MSRKKRFNLAPERQVEVRRAIGAWMARHGHDDGSFARLLGVKPETVGINLGRERYKTRRPISDNFLLRVQRVTGLALVPEMPTMPLARASHPEPSATDLIVLFLARAGIATTAQLARRLRRSRSQLNRMVAPLVKRGTLEREREPAPPSGLARSKEFVYGLGRQGRERAERQLGRAVHSAFVKGHLQAGLFVGHDLLVSEVALRLELELGGQLADWAAGPDCRAQVPGGVARRLVEPDLVFALTLPEGIGCGWVEVETGSVGRQAVQEKTRAADHYYLAGGFLRRWHADRLTVLWIGEDDDHAHRLREWIGPLRPRLMHAFTSWGWLKQLGIAGPIWLTVNGGKGRRSLLTGAPNERNYMEKEELPDEHEKLAP